MKIFLSNVENNHIKDILSYYFDLGGKRMRPTLFYAVSKCFGSQENLSPFSLVLELIHTMSLYHDDVIDHAEERRGAPTVHMKWDIATAIVGGDIFHGLIHKYLIDAIREKKIKDADLALKFLSDLITDVELTIGTAVLKEMQMAKEKEIPDLDTAIKVASEKTAPLFAFSAAAAASLAHVNEEISSKMYRMGLEFGYAFQLLDDLGDFFPSDKGFGNDLKEDRKTPLLVLCNNANPEKLLQYRMLNTNLSEEDISMFKVDFKAQFIEITSWISESIASTKEYMKILPNNEFKENVQAILQMLELKNNHFFDSL